MICNPHQKYAYACNLEASVRRFEPVDWGAYRTDWVVYIIMQCTCRSWCVYSLCRMYGQFPVSVVSHFVQTSLDRQDKLSSGLSAFHLINKGRGGGVHFRNPHRKPTSLALPWNVQTWGPLLRCLTEAKLSLNTRLTLKVLRMLALEDARLRMLALEDALSCKAENVSIGRCLVLQG